MTIDAAVWAEARRLGSSMDWQQMGKRLMSFDLSNQWEIKNTSSATWTMPGWSRIALWDVRFVISDGEKEFIVPSGSYHGGGEIFLAPGGIVIDVLGGHSQPSQQSLA